MLRSEAEGDVTPPPGPALNDEAGAPRIDLLLFLTSPAGGA